MKIDVKYIYKNRCKKIYIYKNYIKICISKICKNIKWYKDFSLFNMEKKKTKYKTQVYNTYIYFNMM